MAPVKSDCLSENDKTVLNAIFNPLQLSGEALSVYDEDLPEQLQDSFEEQTEAVENSIKLELEAVKATEAKNYDLALNLFHQAIDLAPMRAATYNNRAQTYRLLNMDEEKSGQPTEYKSKTPASNLTKLNEALADLQEAIKLSNSTGRTGCKALCQRGLLLRKSGKDDDALADFTVAARLGSKFARTQLVEMNPYAAMCNAMLKDVFAKLRN